MFGRRSQPPTIIIARGDDIRYFTIRPWLAALAGSVLAIMATGYLLGTAYLVLRDDLIGATIARQARLQHAYEDRISALRAQLDRVTSRQLLEQDLMQRKVGELIARQDQLARIHGRLGPILERAGGLNGDKVPVPSPRPEIRASLDYGLRLDETTTGSAYAAARVPTVPWPLRSARTQADADHLFVTIDRSLNEIENGQIERVETLTEQAYQTAEAIAEALSSAGIALDYDEEDVGGPFIPTGDAFFDERVRELDDVLNRLEDLKQTARRMPVANPIPGAAVTSTFGMRRDPILRRPAHHSGVDFRAARGTPIRATGGGTVIHAGWKGGYGRMVEIDHGGGVTTRYAHMSRILVKKGEAVGVGTVLGRAGSSGRSTGPHLHYEVRRNGEAVNPLKFISAGRAIIRYL